MTAQASDVIRCDVGAVDLTGLQLYGVILGDMPKDRCPPNYYSFKRLPELREQPRCSALWRGHTSTFELREDGRLYLVGYQYPLSDQGDDIFEELLEGNFWLIMKPNFNAEAIYVPFVNSQVIADRNRWEHEPSKTNTYVTFPPMPQAGIKMAPPMLGASPKRLRAKVLHWRWILILLICLCLSLSVLLIIK